MHYTDGLTGARRRGLFFALPLALGLFLLASCNQAPIFYYISNEYEPKDPLISGGPTKILEFQGLPHVSNGRLYQYEAGSWQQLPDPDQSRSVKDIAVTTDYLYTLSISGTDSSAELRRKGAGGWETWTARGPIQAVYGAGDTLFAGMNNVLYYVNAAGGLAELRDFGSNGELQGAVFFDGKYYIATTGRGIYAVDQPYDLNDETEPLRTSLDAGQISGLFKIEAPAGSAVIAVSGNGKLWWAQTDNNKIIGEYGDMVFSGAAAVWNNELLLLGIRQGSAYYTYGYRELPLDAVIAGNSPSLLTPGEGTGRNSSVGNYAKYSTSLGKHVINSLYQAQDGVLFASTQKNGLWSYRNDEWNAEE
jgi:hypothetical protein